MVLDTQALENQTSRRAGTVLIQTFYGGHVSDVIKYFMVKRKPVEAAESASVAPEPIKPTRKVAATKPKTATGKAAHKHHSKPNVESLVESAVAPALQAPITHEAIARLAYSYWEARGFQGGSPDEDWLLAERELAKLA